MHCWSDCTKLTVIQYYTEKPQVHFLLSHLDLENSLEITSTMSPTHLFLYMQTTNTRMCIIYTQNSDNLPLLPHQISTTSFYEYFFVNSLPHGFYVEIPWQPVSWTHFQHFNIPHPPFLVRSSEREFLNPLLPNRNISSRSGKILILT